MTPHPQHRFNDLDYSMNDITKPTIDAARLEGLRALDAELAAHRVNMNERVITLVEAYLIDGPATDSDIASALNELGFDRKHVWALLRQDTGPSSDRHRWLRDEDGLLSPHSSLAAAK